MDDCTNSDIAKTLKTVLKEVKDIKVKLEEMEKANSANFEILRKLTIDVKLAVNHEY